MKKVNFIIREAIPGDLPGLTAYRYHPSVHQQRLEDMLAGYLHYFIALDGEIVIGSGLLVFKIPPSWPPVFHVFRLPQVVDLNVQDEYRGKGIGTQLIRIMELEVKKAGLKNLYISVAEDDNPRAVALYYRLGFKRLPGKTYLDHWHTRDREGNVHEGEEWLVDLEKVLTE
jgi:GNAT superfamily N-acetyltransferase